CPLPTGTSAHRAGAMLRTGEPRPGQCAGAGARVAGTAGPIVGGRADRLGEPPATGNLLAAAERLRRGSDALTDPRRSNPPRHGRLAGPSRGDSRGVGPRTTRRSAGRRRRRANGRGPNVAGTRPGLSRGIPGGLARCRTSSPVGGGGRVATGGR